MKKYLTAFLIGALIGALIKDSLLFAVVGGTICVMGAKLFIRK